MRKTKSIRIKMPAIGKTAKQPSLGAMLQSQPDWVKQELKALRKHEQQVLRALEDEDNARLFTENPSELLTKLKVPVSTGLKKRMHSMATKRRIDKFPCLKLANGQTLSPRVRVHFKKEA